MNFGSIKKWILVGGQDLILEAAECLSYNSQNFQIVTGERNLKEQNFNGKILKENLELRGFSYHVSEDINTDEFVKNFIDNETILLSLSSPWIFKKNFIDLFDTKIVNLHEAELPLNRGGATLSWMIMMSSKESASILHLITPKIDEGGIVAKLKYSFPSNCEIPKDYAYYISKKSTELVNKFITKVIAKNGFIVHDQENKESSYWPRLNTEIQGFIDWDWDAKFIKKFIDAFASPYSGARTFLKNKKIIIKKAIFYENDRFHPFQRGIIYKKHDGMTYVACINGELIIKEIADEKNNLIFEELQLGDRFYTPRENLEKALTSRPVYSSKGIKQDDI